MIPKLAKRARTKTVATVGPACRDVATLTELIKRSVDVFRLNMAHGTRADHELAIANIRQAAADLHLPVGILVDLAGPKIRLGALAENPLVLENGDTVTFVPGESTSNRDELVCLYEPLIREVAVGDAIVLADGIARLEAIEASDNRLVCKVIDGGAIRSRQGVNLPGTKLSVPALGDVDKDNAVWAAGQGVDFVSLSFVRNAAEVIELKELLQENGSDAMVVSKVEKAEALGCLDQIVKASDAIMVARGDLGVEIAVEKTPLAQKRIIRTCLQHRKPVIVATQMLESMHTTKQPTRAEVSDVANAILDGADACMLSGETAIGEYPLDSAGMMQRIMMETETMFADRSSRMTSYDSATGWSVTDAVIFASAQIARRVGAEMVVFCTSCRDAAILKSKQRDHVPTVCFTDNEQAYRQMSLLWGVTPVLLPEALDGNHLPAFIDKWAIEHGGAKSGDPVVVVADTELLSGVHDTVMVMKIR
ncbi:MAG: pyruvate kinase [Planctomycetota bacterium]